MHIVVAGHVCLDIVPRIGPTADVQPGRLVEVGPASMSAGGSVGNTAGVLVALGAPVVPYADVGQDDLHEVLLGKLSSLGIAARTLTSVPGASTSYSLVIEKSGLDRTFWHHTGANTLFNGTRVAFDGAAVLHLGYPPLLPALLTDDGEPLRVMLERARGNGVTTSVDLAVVDPESDAAGVDWPAILAAIGPMTDILSPSIDDLTSMLGISEPFSVSLVDRLASSLIDSGVAVVAISAGAEGMFVRTAGRERLARAGHAMSVLSPTWSNRSLHCRPMVTGDPVTTNGAGDATSAGLAFALARGAGLDDAAALAAACSAAVISGRRPTPSTIVDLAPQLVTIFDGGLPTAPAPAGRRP